MTPPVMDQMTSLNEERIAWVVILAMVEVCLVVL